MRFKLSSVLRVYNAWCSFRFLTFLLRFNINKNVAPPSYDEAVKTQTEKAPRSGSHGNKESGRTRQRGQRGLDKTAQDAGVQDQYSSDEDVWTTEDEDNDGNNSDSSQDECYASQSVGDNTISKLRHVFIP